MGLLATTLFSRSRDDQDLVGAYAWSKPISFWQAWGLMLLSQILFKANMQRNVPVGPMRRSRFERAAGPTTAPAGPEQET
jgi:hypothetical protein